MHPDWLRPDWSVPPRVGAVMTTRAGGASTGPYASMNLGAWVGDDPAAVTANRQRLQDACGGWIPLLKQVHGTNVVRLEDLGGDDRPVEADACLATTPGRVCAVTVADCLPVLFADREGRGVAAAHAGWRGLAGGVLDRTVDALCAAVGGRPEALVAWLGPCIGPRAFEVGEDVVHAFTPHAPRPDRFVPSTPAGDGSPRWLADLPGLARDRLQRLGVAAATGGDHCTVSDPSRFFSYRRDGVTGRMAAAVWLAP